MRRARPCAKGGSVAAAEPRFGFNFFRLEGAEGDGSPGGPTHRTQAQCPPYPVVWGWRDEGRCCNTPRDAYTDPLAREPPPEGQKLPLARPAFRPTNAGLRHFRVELRPPPLPARHPLSGRRGRAVSQPGRAYQGRTTPAQEASAEGIEAGLPARVCDVIAPMRASARLRLLHLNRWTRPGGAPSAA